MRCVSSFSDLWLYLFSSVSCYFKSFSLILHKPFPLFSQINGKDEIAKSQVGKVIGGSKGNPVIEFLSVAPNEIVVDTIPDVFDYNELRKYGFGNLCTPIADAGMYLNL